MKTVRLGSLFAAVASLLGAGVSAADGAGYSCPQAGDYANGYPRSRAYLVEWAQELARFVRCDGYPDNVLAGQWDPTDPIWQWRGDMGDGCEVHWKLSRQLDEGNENGNTTPGKKGSKANQGAANALASGNDDGALLHLTNFVTTIEENARVRDEHLFTYTDANGYEQQETHSATFHEQDAQDLAWEGREIMRCVGDLKD
ncbi:MAG: hypothetical protein OEW35_06770 [Gammaproteobacteria bacterium]|nr:hypothetical protein [Gammaproteobacteria bacterium]MDH4253179.1 hypothetical protein [Gammaproteobacteria bacterium]MDH5308459.1 hypothetical protein [Gammaproteobacteria bacterium]